MNQLELSNCSDFGDLELLFARCFESSVTKKKERLKKGKKVQIN